MEITADFFQRSRFRVIDSELDMLCFVQILFWKLLVLELLDGNQRYILPVDLCMSELYSGSMLHVIRFPSALCPPKGSYVILSAMNTK